MLVNAGILNEEQNETTRGVEEVNKGKSYFLAVGHYGPINFKVN